MNPFQLIREALGDKFGPDNDNAAGMVLALNRTAKHVYGGTVPPAEVARRRAANRRARAARKGNVHRAKVTAATRRARIRRYNTVADRSTWANR